MSKMFFWQKMSLVSVMFVPMAEAAAESVWYPGFDGLLRLAFADLLSRALGLAAMIWISYATLRRAWSKSPVDSVGPASAALALSTAPQAAGLVLSHVPFSFGSAAVTVAVALFAGLDLARGAGAGALGWALALLPVQAIARQAAWSQSAFMDVLVPVACLVIVSMAETTGVEAAKTSSSQSEN